MNVWYIWYDGMKVHQNSILPIRSLQIWIFKDIGFSDLRTL